MHTLCARCFVTIQLPSEATLAWQHVVSHDLNPSPQQTDCLRAVPAD